MPKRLFIPLLIGLLPSTLVLSQSFATATQTVTLEVRSVSSLAVSGDPGPLVISTATAGGEKLSALDESTSYSITTNRPGRKLSMSLDQAMPAGTKLIANIESSNGISLGPVELLDAASPVSVASNIAHGTAQNQKITYTFEADARLGVMAPETRTIILTLTD